MYLKKVLKFLFKKLDSKMREVLYCCQMVHAEWVSFPLLTNDS